MNETSLSNLTAQERVDFAGGAVQEILEMYKVELEVTLLGDIPVFYMVPSEGLFEESKSTH